MASLKALLPAQLQTERLDLEPFTLKAEQFACCIEGFNGKQAVELQGRSDLNSPAAIMRTCIPFRLRGSWLANGMADVDLIYFARLRSTGELIGCVSVQHRCAGAQLLPPDMGWTFIESHFGKGYATEAAREVLRFTRDDLGIQDLCVLINERNKPSLRVAQKLGFGGSNQVFVQDEEKWAPVWVLPHMGSLGITEPLHLGAQVEEWEKQHGAWGESDAKREVAT